MCLTASSFAKHPEAKPSGEAPGFFPTLAFQDSKFAPLHANRGANLPSFAVVPAKSRVLGGGRLSKIPRSLRGCELLAASRSTVTLPGLLFCYSVRDKHSTSHLDAPWINCLR
jgi:hypothetical protein